MYIKVDELSNYSSTRKKHQKYKIKINFKKTRKGKMTAYVDSRIFYFC